MAKGLEKHQAHQEALQFLGKDLAKRAKSKCELCSCSGQPLIIFEVPPAPKEPELNGCLMICHPCNDSIKSIKKSSSDQWRCLNEAVWSETEPVQVMAVRILRAISNSCDWASEILDGLYLEPEIEERIQKAEL